MTLAVVGAGPCGCCMALLLAKRGHQVHLYEHRSNPTEAAGRSISLAISARGLAACERIGVLSDIMQLSVPMIGRMIYHREWLYGRQQQCIRAIARSDLCGVMLSRCKHNPDIQFLEKHFSIKSDYEAVFACDGVNSECRQWLVQHDGLEATIQKHNLWYVEVGGEVFDYSLDHLNIWPDPMLIGLPNRQGGLSMTLFGEDLSNVQEILDAKHIGNLRALSGAAYPLVSVQCSRLHGSNVVLLGDAAHAILPFYGQGMNSALEDCMILDDLLDHCFSWQEAFEVFTHQRMSDLEALRQLADDNYHSMSRGVSWVDWADNVLAYLFPDHYQTTYQMVSFSLRPYREALQQKRRIQHAASFVAILLLLLVYLTLIDYRILLRLP